MPLIHSLETNLGTLNKATGFVYVGLAWDLAMTRSRWLQSAPCRASNAFVSIGPIPLKLRFAQMGVCPLFGMSLTIRPQQSDSSLPSLSPLCCP
jgi:hypothetical protein